MVRATLVRASAVVVAVTCCALTVTAAAQVVRVTPVAVGGQPSGVPGSNFTAFDAYPAIDERGHVTFLAGLSNFPPDSTFSLWSGPPGQLQLVGRANAPVPGDPLGRRFVVHEDFDRFAPLHGRTAFRAEFRYPDQTERKGLWQIGPSGPTLLAESGTPAPGGGTFRDWNFLATNPAGQSVFSGFIEANGAHRIWENVGGPSTLRAMTGDAAPGTGNGAFANFGFPTISPSGRIAFNGGLAVGTGGTTIENSSGVWTISGGATQLLVRSGDPVPGLPGQTIGLFHFQPKFNRLDQLVMTAARPQGDLVVLRHDGAALHTVAATGQPAPGMGAGATFSSVAGQAMADDGRVVLNAGVMTAQSHTSAIYVAHPGGAFDLIAGLDQQVPGEPNGTRFNLFTRAIMNAGGQVAFLARFLTPQNDVVFDTIFMTDTQGELHRVAGPGMSLEVAPGEFRTVFRVSTYFSSFSDADRSDFNDLGQLAFRAQFTDGTEGAFVAVVPEPGAALGAVCSLLLLRQRWRGVR